MTHGLQQWQAGWGFSLTHCLCDVEAHKDFPEQECHECLLSHQGWETVPNEWMYQEWLPSQTVNWHGKLPSYGGKWSMEVHQQRQMTPPWSDPGQTLASVLSSHLETSFRTVMRTDIISPPGESQRRFTGCPGTVRRLKDNQCTSLGANIGSGIYLHVSKYVNKQPLYVFILEFILTSYFGRCHLAHTSPKHHFWCFFQSSWLYHRF